MRPPATGWPTRTAPRSPRAPEPVDAATHAPGPDLDPEQRSRPAAGPTARRLPPAGTPAPLRVRPPQLGLHGAVAPCTPSDPTVWGSWGLCQPPAGPPAPPSNRHGPRSRSAARRYPCARPRPQFQGNATSSPQVPRPAEGPAPGTPAKLRTRPPPARPPTLQCGALRATADRRLDRPHPPATATGPAPAWRRVRPGRPPVPMRPARASTPRRLCRAASGTQSTGTGTRGQHLNRTRHTSNCGPMFVLLCSRPCALPPP